MVVADRVMRTFKGGFVVALDNVSFCVSQGEMVGIIGKNGVGKTTLLKMIAGVLYPSDGNLWVFEKEPCSTVEKNRKNMGYLFSNYNALEFCTTLSEGCKMNCEFYDISKKDFEEVFQTIGIPLGIDVIFDKPLRQLSVGQMRIAEFFHAIIHRPKLLLLDEPTIGVDKEGRKTMCEALKLLNKVYKTTILMASHDMNSLEKICDRILLLQEGKLTFDGRWDSLKEHSDAYRKASFITEKMIDFDDLPIKFIKYEEKRMELLFSQNQISRENLYRIISSKASVKNFQIDEPPIEDIVCEVLKGGI